jgi:hypothetical protein
MTAEFSNKLVSDDFEDYPHPYALDDEKRKIIAQD